MAQDHFERHNRPLDAYDWNFNVTFEDQPSIADMVEAYRPLITRPEFYEPIPAQWIHSTILRVGNVDEYSEAEMLAVAEKVQARVRGMQLPEFHLSPPKLVFGNVVFLIEPESELEKLYTAVTESLEDVVGPDRATKSPYGRFIPHTSIIYTKQRDNEAETEAMLAAANIEPARFHVTHMPLIKQKPANGHYEWEVVNDIRIG